MSPPGLLGGQFPAAVPTERNGRAWDLVRTAPGMRGARSGQTKLDPGFLTGKAKVSRYLLSGLLQCGACGGSMHGRTTWKGKRRKDGSRVGTSYYVCGAAITKGKTVCQPIQFLQSAMDDFVTQVVGERIAAFLGKNGRATLKRLVLRELGGPGYDDPRPEIRRLKTRLAGIATKMDSVIDLAASSPDCKELLTDRLGRLRDERQEIQSRLKDLEVVPIRTADPDAVVEAILDGLRDAHQLFELGTMEERKRVVRAFVDGLTVVGSSRSGRLRMKKLPAPESLGTGNSVDLVAGVLYVAIHNILEGHLRKVVPIRRTRRRRGPDGPPEYPRIQRIPIRPNGPLETILDRVLEKSA